MICSNSNSKITYFEENVSHSRIQLLAFALLRREERERHWLRSKRNDVTFFSLAHAAAAQTHTLCYTLSP